MTSIVQHIIKLGEERNTKGLENYVKCLPISEITSLLSEQICLRNSSNLWNYLLQSFPEEPGAQERRFQMVQFTLGLLDTTEVSNNTCNSVTTRLCIELPKFKTEDLVVLCESCVDKINKGTSTSAWWRDLLPEILSVLDERHAGFEQGMTGAEFKKEVLKSLCDRYTHWSPNIVTTLASMFCDLSLGKDDHLQIVVKLAGCVELIPPQEIPSYVYQMLRLCRTQNSRVLFFRLEKYFTTRVHKKIANKEPTSETTDMDEIVDSTEQDAMEAESMVLYHVHNLTSIGNGCVKDYLALLKVVFRAPEIVIHPFHMSVLLTVSTIGIYEEQVFEILRGSVSKMVHEEFMRLESAWFKEMSKNTIAIDKIFTYIIDTNLRERELIIEGLINFSFVLLNFGAALGGQHIAKRLWQLGTQILLHSMKKKREASNTILQNLTNRIVTGVNVPQMTDCLYQMCKTLTLITLENQSVIIQMIEQLPYINSVHAKLIIDAILPLVRVSPAVRDNLILILRKALYSKSVEIRQMAVIGFLKLVKNLKVQNLAAMSQNSNSSGSSRSLMTQISLDCRSQTSSGNKFGNEALCLEVLGILRRCFMQQAEVRSQLYEGLYDAVCMNPELGVPVLDILWIHFSQFYQHDEQTLPPLDFNQITTTKGANVELLEPLGQLVFAVGLIVNKLSETDEGNDINSSIIRFTKVLESLCTRMAKCELIHYELDDGTDLTDILPESQAKLIVLKQIMSVCEALMGYNICAWGPKYENAGRTINSLFVCHTRMVDFLKDLNKPKKVTQKKSTDETKLETSTADKTAGKIKSFKYPATVLDFQTIGKAINLLYESTPSWTTAAQVSILKVKREFHRYVLNVALQLVQDLKHKDTMELKYTKYYYGYCTEIAATIYERVIQRMDHMIDFDCTTAVLATELFQQILQFVITNHKGNLVSFLTVVGTKEKDEDLAEHLLPFILEFQKLFEENERDDVSEDPEAKKLPMLYINIYTLLVNQLPQTGSHAIQILEWLTKYTEDKSSSNKLLANALIALQLSLHIRCKSSGTIFENVAIKLCNIMGAVNQDKPDCPVALSMVNEGTALSTLLTLANTLKKSLDDVSWLIQRCKAEHSLNVCPGVDKKDKRRENLQPKESVVCSQLVHIILVCKSFCNLAVPTGVNTEALLKIILQLYSTLNALTKYFILTSSGGNPSFQNARFEQVIKISSKQLSPVVYDLILFIEESQQPSADAPTQKKSANPTKSKVLKDTKLIPKVVYEVEQFGKNVTQLSNKTKIDLMKHVGPGTMRDFRIKAPILDTALQELRDANADDSAHVTAEDMEVDDSNDSVGEAPEAVEAPRKKRKTK